MTKGRDLSIAADMQLGTFRNQVPETRELSVLQETGLITPQQAEELAVATRDLRTMEEVSSIPQGRHFGYIDTILSARAPSPVSKARDLLQELGSSWEHARGDFQRLRKVHFEVKLKRAELVKMEQAVDRCDDDGDRGILEAKRDLLTIEIEDLESDLTYGMRKLQGVTEAATASADRYRGLLTESGKDALTAEDFLEEDLGYYLKAAFFHASQTVQVRQWVPGGIMDPKVWRQLTKQQREEFVRQNAQQAMTLGEEVLIYFDGLGIAKKEITGELEALAEMRKNFDIVNGGAGRHNQAFQAHFDNWLARMATKYLDRARSAVGQFGVARIQRIVQIIEPTRSDGRSVEYEDDGLNMRNRNRESFLG